MKIVKEGHPRRVVEVAKRITCRHCNGILEITKSDVYSYENGTYYVECPMCRDATLPTRYPRYEVTITDELARELGVEGVPLHGKEFWKDLLCPWWKKK